MSQSQSCGPMNHHYVPDIDGMEFCDRCGHCPAEQLADLEADEDN